MSRFSPFLKEISAATPLLLWNVGYLAHLILEMLFSMLQVEKDSLFQHSYFSCAL